MKKTFIYSLLLSLFVLPFAGCLDDTAGSDGVYFNNDDDPASATVPWNRPADYEGGGPGMPDLTSD